ncbi:ricin-type beta-trefoil lectin domain protein [Streptomyces spiramenti]|uniref:ricin-type beta-trefoil lectin domain protein n=1 Tax=Streptomyces spiramenti TaxID=2720606 RepID=UPI00308440A5
MTLWTSLEPASATVDPGAVTQVRLRVRNTGDVVDEYRFEPVGAVSPWTTVEPQTLRLYPGTTGTVQLTFAPPRSPDATAGPNPYAVRITPTEHPEAVTVPEGNLTITPFTEVRAELVPPVVKGWFRGRPQLAVDNLGNTRFTASVSGVGNGDQLSFQLHPSNIQVEPGRAAFVQTTIKPREAIWFGSAEEHPYRLELQRSQADPVQVEGTFHQRGLLPAWLATAIGLMAALTLAFVILWITHNPVAKTRAGEFGEVGESAPLDPRPDVEPELPAEAAAPPPPEPPPVEPPPLLPSEELVSPDGAGGDGGGGGGGEEEEEETGHPLLPAKEILLYNVHTELCAGLPGEGPGEPNGRVVQKECDTEDVNQRWDLEVTHDEAGPGGTQLFVIRNVADGLCMDLPGTGGQPIRTRVGEWYCDRTFDNNQLWWLDEPEHGDFWIRSMSSNSLCLEVGGNRSTTVGASIMIHECGEGTDDREWQIYNEEEAERL